MRQNRISTDRCLSLKHAYLPTGSRSYHGNDGAMENSASNVPEGHYPGVTTGMSWTCVQRSLSFKATWATLADVRQTYNSTDVVGQWTVFNVKDDIRIIATIDYEWRKVFIKHVLTLSEYDRERWK